MATVALRRFMHVLDVGEAKIGPSLDSSANDVARWRLTSTTLLLALVLALAVTLRVLWVAFVSPDPRDGRVDDSLFYDFSAQSLAKGTGYVHFFRSGEDPPPTAQWPPGYSLVLAAIYKVSGNSVLLAKGLNVLAGAATCLVVYLIGARMFDRRVGLVGALVLALFPSQIFGTTLIMTEVVWTFVIMSFLLAVVHFTLRPGPWWQYALVGLVLGVISLIRGETLFFALALIPVWAVAHKSWRRGLAFGGLALLGALAAIAPWVIRNQVQLGYPVLISTGAAENLIAGHWDGADGLGSFTPVMEVQKLYEDVPRPQSEVEIYKEQTQRAIEYAVSHPLDEALLIPEKLFHFYRDDSRPLVWIQDNKGDLELSRTAEQWLRDMANTYYFAVIAGTLLGMPLWVSRRDPKKLLFVMLMLYYSFMFGFVFVGEPRFHSVLIPAFALFAAAALVWASERLMRPTERPTAQPSASADAVRADAASRAKNAKK